MEFRILGPLEATNAGRPIELGGRKPRSLLAVLLLRANEVVSVDVLIDELWGEEPPRSAGHTLQAYVSRLRRALRAGGGDDGVLVTRPSGYMLRVGFGELDLDRFEHLAEEGRRALAASSFGRAAEKLHEALALWRGHPLDDLSYEPFARVDVARLEERRLVVVEDLIDAELACGRHAVVVPELEGLVEQHPLRERLRVQLMLALYRSGRQADALEAYRDARNYLVEELGLEPSEQLRALEQAVLRQDQALELAPMQAVPVSVLPTGSGKRDPGRVAELASVDARGAEARQQSGNGSRHQTVAGPRLLAPRRLALILAVCAVALVAGIGARLVANGGRGRPAGLAAADVQANAVVFADVGRRELVAQEDTGGRPTAMSMGAGALWVTDGANDRVLKIDPIGHRVEDQIPVGRDPSAVVATQGAVWVANTGSGTISEISPTSGRVVATLRVGNAPTAIAAGAGAIWVADASDGTLRRIDPRTASVVATIVLAQPLSDVAVGSDAVWVSSAASGLLIRVEPRGNWPVQTIAVGNGPTSIAVTHGAVWVANPPDDTISRIDEETGSVRKINVSDPGGLVSSEGKLWVARPQREDVAVIDPDSRAIERLIPTGNPVGTLTTSAGNLALATLAAPTSHRGGTLRVVGGSGLDSIDPGEAYSALGWQVLSLTNDGLLTYARTSGPAGATIVPDLATSLPIVLDGGRTFTFRLRAVARYSTGAPVRPEDFRASIERQYRASTGLAALGVAIVGADRCSRQRCDLTRGIALDDSARTITFRLSADDPAFLYKLALPFGAAVPSGSPPIGASTRPLPDTGPYVIERYVRGQKIVLVRNPRFSSSSIPAQHAGFPDRITFELGLDSARQAAAVADGRADAMLDSPPPSALSRLRLRVPLQLHSNTLPVVDAVFLNTRAAPFDRPAVRRALDMAVDRSAIVRILGGATVARTTCQILPPSFPGYEPFCPYTARPNAAGVWRAPDLVRARRLVSSSGTSGMAITVSTVRGDASKLATGRYFVGLLRRLGYVVTLRLYPTDHAYYGAIGMAGAKSQIGVFDWFADYQAGSAFFQPLFTCESYTPAKPFSMNVAGICDPRLDRRIAAATELQLKNPAAANLAWTRIDRAITSSAPWIPLVNPIGVDFVAARVGNYQRNPAFGILLDQLWVR